MKLCLTQHILTMKDYDQCNKPFEEQIIRENFVNKP